MTNLPKYGRFFIIYSIGDTLIKRENALIKVDYVSKYGKKEACQHFHISESKLKEYLAVASYEETEEEVTDDLVKLSAQKQRLTDINTVIKKENRESYRLYNSLDEVYREYTTLLKSCPLADFKLDPIVRIPEDKPKWGILQLSDIHCNEIIEPTESNGNSFDFLVFAKRLQKFVDKAKCVFKAQGITHILVAGTGDWINSDRRLSEKLASATSQVRAALLTTYLIQQAIIDLSKDFSVAFAGVVGNETRLGENDFDTSDILASNNWDYMIYEQLKMLFTGRPVSFPELHNHVNDVVKLPNGFNVLLTHGTFFKNSPDRSLPKIVQNYTLRGIPIHMALCGHIHSAAVGDIVSRSASLCGGNSYSTNDLGCASRASQNIYIINDDLGYDGIKIDLQNTDGYEGYHIIPELERYNVRSASPNTKVTITSLV